MAAAVLIVGHGTDAQQLPRFKERVAVARLIVDTRVLDDHGNPVLGLAADAFRVKVDGRLARVETATWVGGEDAGSSAGPVDARPWSDAGPATGRLIVFLFQKNLEPSRVVGLMRMLVESRQLLTTLTPNDRIAILSFDSHLRIWTDFTNDRERLERVFAHDLLLGAPPAVLASEVLSLAERLNPAAARRAYGVERALELIGEALEPLPGSKSLVLIGHGFGRFGRGGLAMENDYEPARRALVASRTSVFSLDVTDADYHSLEAGLQLVSDDTGGFYARAHLFPGQAIRRLAGALAGYYVLFVEKPESLTGPHDLSVALARGKGHVLATSTYAARAN
jgi:VWFA-related protein